MRLFRILIMFAAMPLAMASIARRAVAFALDAIDTVFGTPSHLFELGVFPRVTSTVGHSLDPSVQHSLRHEAGVSRRAAPRNT